MSDEDRAARERALRNIDRLRQLAEKAQADLDCRKRVASLRSMYQDEVGYAIVRLDLDYTDEDRVVVKRVVWSEAAAAAEVDRLNAMNSDKNCRYFWRYTRVDRRDERAAVA